MKLAVVYGTTSLLPIVLWVTRNLTVNGTLNGPRGHRSGQSLWDSLNQSGDLLYLWIFINKKPGWLAVGLWITATLILLQAIVFVYNMSGSGRSYLKTWKQKLKYCEEPKARPAFPFAAFTVVYFVALNIMVPQQTEHAILLRYIVPVYVPLVITAAIWLDRFLVAPSIRVLEFSFGIQLKSSSGRWSISYNNTLSLMDVLKWIFLGLALSIILTINVRSIVLHIDVLAKYLAITSTVS